MFTEATLLLNGMSSVALCCDLGALHRVTCLKDQPYHWHANTIASFLWMPSLRDMAAIGSSTASQSMVPRFARNSLEIR